MSSSSPKEAERRLTIPLVGLALLSIFFWRAFNPISSGTIDVDFYWHLSYGEWILDHMAIPTHDFWSWTADGKSYRLTQWLGETVMAAAYRLAGGELGTQVLSAALVSGTLGFSYLTARVYLDNRLAALMVAIGCGSILISLPCRPHQFTHLGLAMMTYLVSSYLARGSRIHLYLIPVLAAAWVNLHGGYVVGLGYVWLVSFSVFADAYMNNRLATAWHDLAPMAVAAVVATLATLLNPYGWGAWQYAFEIASLKSSSAGIVDEWGPTNIKLDVGLNWFMASMATLGAFATSRSRPTLAMLLMAIAIIAAGWSALRVALMMTILLVPLLAASLKDTALYQLAFTGEVRRYDFSLRWTMAIPIVGTILAFSVISGGNDAAERRYVEENLPVDAVSFIKENRVEGKLLNNPEIGGYLIRHLGQKVFLDTRLDLYGDRALFEFLFARKGEPGWREFIERHDPDVVILDNISALRQLMIDAGMYRLVFEGVRYSVLVRPAARPDIHSAKAGNGRQDLLNLLKS